MKRYKPQSQLSIKEFAVPFEANLDPSLLIHIRKRIGLETFELMTDELNRRDMKLKEVTPGKSKEYH